MKLVTPLLKVSPPHSSRMWLYISLHDNMEVVIVRAIRMIHKEFARSTDQTQSNCPAHLKMTFRFCWKGRCLESGRDSSGWSAHVCQKWSNVLSDHVTSERCQGKSWKKFLAKQMTSSAKSGAFLALFWHWGGKMAGERNLGRWDQGSRVWWTLLITAHIYKFLCLWPCPFAWELLKVFDSICADF